MINTVPARSKKHQGTLAEVALEAGVSIATVSRVLNGENKELWEGAAARGDKIRQIAKSLGYRPDWRARALRATQTHSIGVVYSQTCPLMDMTSYARMFRAFGEVLQPAGYHMMFVHVPKTAGVLPASILQAVDAAVFYHSVDEGEIEASKAIRGPAIQVNCEPKLPLPHVGPDEVGGAAQVAQHLLNLGHRRITFLDISREGTEFDHYSHIVREETIRKTMVAAGFESGFRHWHEDFYTPLPEMVSRFIEMPREKRPTAIVISYSLQAIAIMNLLMRRGIKIPEDVSIVTFDDHELVAEAFVPMTTVAMPMEDIGRTAAGLILGLLQQSNTRVVKSSVLPERLVPRRSSGPAPR